MPDDTAPTPPSQSPPEDKSGPQGVRGAAQRARTLAKEHPTLTLAAAAGVGAVAGVPFAFGALVGIAATSVVATRTGREVRQDLVRRGRELLERYRKPDGQQPKQG